MLPTMLQIKITIFVNSVRELVALLLDIAYIRPPVFDTLLDAVLQLDHHARMGAKVIHNFAVNL